MEIYTPVKGKLTRFQQIQAQKCRIDTPQFRGGDQKSVGPDIPRYIDHHIIREQGDHQPPCSLDNQEIAFGLELTDFVKDFVRVNDPLCIGAKGSGREGESIGTEVFRLQRGESGIVSLNSLQKAGSILRDLFDAGFDGFAGAYPDPGTAKMIDQPQCCMGLPHIGSGRTDEDRLHLHFLAKYV